jgi:hypothetical protein
MSEAGDVAIVGAGPYGLSLAAHLRAAGIEARSFGIPMQLWRAHMPEGMILKSNGFASNLSSPDKAHTLQAFCAATGRPYAHYGLPVPLETFAAYGSWFQQSLVDDLEPVLVRRVAADKGRFALELDNGEALEAGQVVVAVGVEHFAVVPDVLRGLPSELCSHSSAHASFAGLAGKRVAVVGGGQSALESAALLHEQGAEVELVVREGRLAWNGAPLVPDRTTLAHLREPESGLGSGWAIWFYSHHPDKFRHLPARARAHRARTALGPAGAWWLPGRVEGRFPVHLGHRVVAARAERGGVRLVVAGPGGEQELLVDHCIAATGFQPDLSRLSFLEEGLRRRVRTIACGPAVDARYRSSVAGLSFAGPAVAASFGPVMRFVYGADHAARTVTRALVAEVPQRTRALALAG